MGGSAGFGLGIRVDEKQPFAGCVLRTEIAALPETEIGVGPQDFEPGLAFRERVDALAIGRRIFMIDQDKFGDLRIGQDGP